MPIALTPSQVALRIVLAIVASFLIGYDRDERGKPTGIRTVMLVCLAATLAMLQANLLMNSTGKASDSFVVLDLMRLPLGILSGIGFIGAGAILHRNGLVQGLTTAATLWYVTVLGLLFGGGQLRLAIAATVIALFILWIMKYFEKHLSTGHTGTLCIELHVPNASPLPEPDMRTLIHNAGFCIDSWSAQYIGPSLHTITCQLSWTSSKKEEPSTPSVIHTLAGSAAISSLSWKS